MTKRDITGVKGFFRDYGKNGSPPNTQAAKVDRSKRTLETEAKGVSEPIRARVGRPPGITNGSRSEKTKATMHISESLLNYYRDWSWEERCNLGQLIERAMVAYKETRSKPSTGQGVQS